MQSLVPKFLFSKQQRLLNPSEFKKTIGSPVAKITNEAFVMYLHNEDNLGAEVHPRLGLAITKRNIKKAVQRNTIKRILRESFRLNYLNLPKLMIVIMSRRDLLALNKQEVRNKIDDLWVQLQRKFPISSISSVSS